MRVERFCPQPIFFNPVEKSSVGGAAKPLIRFAGGTKPAHNAFHGGSYTVSRVNLERRPTNVARLHSTLRLGKADSSARTIASIASAGTAALR